jgi:putative tricarboxylic transport membrane protein
MLSTLAEAFSLVAAPDVLLAILLASIYGLAVGSLPASPPPWRRRC